MRLALLATIALLPSAAFAQAGSQTLQAGVSQPAPFVHEAAAPLVSVAPRYKDVVKSSLSSPLMDVSVAQGGTLSYSLSATGLAQSQIVAPVLTYTVGRVLPVTEAQNSDADVTLALAVDSQGRPCEIAVLHSAGKAIDKGTIDAVKQFRFKPATYQNEPIVAHLTLEVKIQK